MKDKYSAVWVSHSSLSDYLHCPRAYYLRNMYRDPKTNHKISLIEPALAVGQVVHDTIDALTKMPAEERFRKPLMETFETKWVGVSGSKGGFADELQEAKLKERAQSMIQRITDHPGPLIRKMIKIRQDLPYFWLSEEDNIILCGKVDWLEYIGETDSVRVIDFKTGKFDEDPDSLQLPIYLLLATNTQTKRVSGISYWYLDRDDNPTDLPLPNEGSSRNKILEIAKKIVLARKLNHFQCKENGCRSCRPLESVISGKCKYVGVNSYNVDVYTLLA
jgi:ATP-dependent helicase/DNAse subunit B